MLWVLVAGLLIWVFCLLSQKKDLEDKNKQRGDVGEQLVQQELNKLGCPVLNDIILDTGSGTTQIDHIVISPYGVFLVETKNYKGSVRGSRDSKDWLHTVGKETYSFHNPIMQNNAHIYAVDKLLKSYNINITNCLYNIVVFTETDISAVKGYPEVVNLSELNAKIRGIARNKVMSPAIVNKITNIISNSDKGVAYLSSHISQVKAKQIKNSVDYGRCPVCGGSLRVVSGKYGDFIGCSNYPKCKYTNNIR